MNKINLINNKLWKKFLCSILLIILLFNFVRPNFIYAATGDMSIDMYIITLVQNLANEDGKIPYFQYSDGTSYVDANQYYDIKKILNDSSYNMPDNIKQEDLFKIAVRNIIDDIFKSMINKYNFTSDDDLKQSLYDILLYQPVINEKYVTGEDGTKYTCQDIRIKYTIKDTTYETSSGQVTERTFSIEDISFSDGMLDAIKSRGIEFMEPGETEEEIFIEDEEIIEVKDGIYQYEGVNDSYICTVNAAIPIWGTEEVRKKVKEKTEQVYGQNFDTFNWDKVLTDFGDDVSAIGIIFNQIDESKNPKGDINDVYIDFDRVIDIEKYGDELIIDSVNVIDLGNGVFKYKGKEEYICTVNKGISVWGDVVKQLIMDKVSSGEYAHKWDETFEGHWDEIFAEFGDNIQAMGVNFTEIDESGNPEGDIKDVYIKFEIIDAYVVTLKDNDASDIGGILLSPVFYLVNIVADAITSNLGNIMEGDSLSLTDGFKVLQSTRQPVTGEINHKIDLKSFTLGGIQYPNIKYTPERIFAGTNDLLSIDFISGKVAEIDADGNVVMKDNENEDWGSIRKTISQWYQVLRMVAIIGLLSALIYTGIKIIISANAKDKAKYKEWIMDWLMAVAILFAMHIIMAFIITVTGELSAMISGASSGINVELINTGTATHEDTGKTFSTNLMGIVRFMVQSENFYMKVGYEVMYIALIVYTIKFTLVYLKRVLNMAFLTLIAPIVALMYPIDKINDGQAQAFNMWLKEYIFNALLQPMHCIMYYILVGSAVSIAASNPIYGIVVLMFMTEAEKLLKKIFGFDKAKGGTVGGMAGAFAAGAIASNIKSIVGGSKRSGGNSGKGGSNSDSDEMLDNPKPTAALGMAPFAVDDEGESDFEEQPTTEEQPTEDEGEKEKERQRLATEKEYLKKLEEERATDKWDKDGDERAYQELKQDVEAREARLNPQEEPTPLPTATPDGVPAATPTPVRGTTSTTAQGATPLASGAMVPRSSAPGVNQSASAATPLPAQAQTPAPPQPTTAPIQQVAQKKEQSRFAKGAKAVGKRLLKPVWDLDHTGKEGAKYNGKRLVRKIGKGALKAAVGFSLGAAAAAVQAGISITDGKYSPMEGFATFTAGAVGGSRIVDGMARGMGSIADTYREGSLPDDSKERKQEIMRRAQKRYPDREDVIEFNKKNYTSKEKNYTAKDYMERQRDHYLTAGVTDLKEMKSGLKYADAIVKRKGDLTDEQLKVEREKADQKAAATIDFRKTLKEQGQLGAVYDKDKQDKYIKTMVDRMAPALNPNASPEEQKNILAQRKKIQRQYENAFKSVAEYDAANA